MPGWPQLWISGNPALRCGIHCHQGLRRHPMCQILKSENCRVLHVAVLLLMCRSLLTATRGWATWRQMKLCCKVKADCPLDQKEYIRKCRPSSNMFCDLLIFGFLLDWGRLEAAMRHIDVFDEVRNLLEMQVALGVTQADTNAPGIGIFVHRWIWRRTP